MKTILRGLSKKLQDIWTFLLVLFFPAYTLAPALIHLEAGRNWWVGFYFVWVLWTIILAELVMYGNERQ